MASSGYQATNASGYYSGGGPQDMYGMVPFQQQRPPGNHFQQQQLPPHYTNYGGYPPLPPVSHYRPPPPMPSHNQFMNVPGAPHYPPHPHATGIGMAQPPYYECYQVDNYEQPSVGADNSYSFSSKPGNKWDSNNNRSEELSTSPKIRKSPGIYKPSNNKKADDSRIEKQSLSVPRGDASTRSPASSSTGKPKRAAPPEQVHYMITVDVKGLRQWSKFRNKFNLIFEIYGILDSAVVPMKGMCKRFKLRTGRDAIDCVFYEIDRELGRIIRGHWVRCVGKLECAPGRAGRAGRGEGKTVTCVSVRPATMAEQASQEAMAAMCHDQMTALTAAGATDTQH